MFFKLSWPKGRSENPEGVGQVVIQGPLKEKVFRLFLTKSRQGRLAPFAPTLFQRPWLSLYQLDYRPFCKKLSRERGEKKSITVFRWLLAKRI